MCVYQIKDFFLKDTGILMLKKPANYVRYIITAIYYIQYHMYNNQITTLTIL